MGWAGTQDFQYKEDLTPMRDQRKKRKEQILDQIAKAEMDLERLMGDLEDVEGELGEEEDPRWVTKKWAFTNHPECAISIKMGNN